MAAPLAALCVADVSKKCVGKSGLRKEMCENAWAFEAKNCPGAMRAAHERCVSSVQNLETSNDVCVWGKLALTPGVETIAKYMRDPGLTLEFEQNWPTWCHDMQTEVAQNLGDGEKICTEMENEVVKLVASRSRK